MNRRGSYGHLAAVERRRAVAAVSEPVTAPEVEVDDEATGAD